MLLFASAIFFTVASALVNTTSGVVEGFSPVPGVTAYLGIPYAQPPVGPLRFRPPEEHPFITEIINATAYTKQCYQFQYLSPLQPTTDFGVPWEEQDEDCLHLNIWAPATATPSSGLAVLFWIHGGGFVEGSAMSDIYNAQNVVENNDDIIVVAINYRLNIFGFPTLPESGPQNLGLLDQRAAIEWVYNNIADFGGDPDKITIFGESAGSRAVTTYPYAYPENPLIRAVIGQSGTAVPSTDTPPSTDFVRISAELGCVQDTDDALLGCLQGLDGLDIRLAVSNSSINTFGSSGGGSPGIDNKTIFTAAEYARKSQEGEFAQVPLLIGQTDHEGDVLIGFDLETGIDYAASDALTKQAFTCPSKLQALYWYRQNIPVYRYRYMPRLPSVTRFEWLRGGFHFSEVPVILGTMEAMQISEPEDYEIAVSKYVQRAWVEFAKDPVDGLANYGWPRYEAENPEENTLIEIAPENNAGVDLVSPLKYDEGCPY